MIKSSSAKQQRTDIKEKARVNTPEPYATIIESGRPMEGEKAKLKDPTISNPTKTNIDVNETMKAAGAIGKGLTALAVINSVYNIAKADNPAKQTVKGGLSWTGAVVGGELGGKLGGGIAGPYGAIVGGVIGSIIGSGAFTPTPSARFKKWDELGICATCD